MAIPPVNFQKIILAMSLFDKELRNTDEWKGWETNKAQTYVIEYEGRRYPPKKIVSLATGVPVSTFVGGPETNEYLEKLGLKVIRLRELKINDALQLICERYKTARETESFKGGNSIRELFDECRKVFQKSEIVLRYPNIKVVSSYGKGNWATIPWISFLDLRVTNTTQDGTYVVILFNEGGTGCYIKMAQGVTKPDKKFGVKAVEVLHQRAEELRSRYGALKGKGFELSGVTDLGSDKKLAKLYEASTIASKYYQVDNFPSEEQVYKDLNDLLVCYDDYAKTRDTKIPPAVDSRDVVLIGTWRDALSEFEQVKQFIDKNGAWASWSSFRVRPEAGPLIKKPFYLYINTGRGEISVRLLMDDYQSSQGTDGIVSPWPEVTPDKWKNITKLSAKQSEIFKTWSRAIKIERIDKNIDDFEPVPGLSNKENILNQMSFGYAYESSEENEEETEDTVNDSLLELCNTAHNNITAASFRVQKSTMIRFAASLLAKRFVILTGLSGSGKTKLAHTFASWMSKQPQQYLMVAVGADWTSNECFGSA